MRCCCTKLNLISSIYGRLYDSATGLLLYRSQPGRVEVIQSTQVQRYEAHGASATINI